VSDGARNEIAELRRLLEAVTHERDSLADERDSLADKHDALADERDSLADERDSLSSENHLLKLRVKELAARLYGRKSERLTSADLLQLVLNLGATPEQAAEKDPVVPPPPAPTDERPDDTSKPPKSRNRTRSMSVDDDAQRTVDRTIEVPVAERACGQCGVEMPVFDYLEHARVEYVPARVAVHIVRREKRACKQPGCKGDAVTADRDSVPDSPLRVGTSVLVELIESKCDDALPVHRQCDRFSRLGFHLPEPTAYGYWRYATELVLPVAAALVGHILEDPVWIGVDDTRLDVLDPTRKGGKYRGHLWCLRASSGLVGFQFTETWEAAEIADWFTLLGEDTHVQVDDYKGYGSEVNGRIVIPPERRLGCMMHVRRRFYEALKLGDERARKPVLWIKDIYKIEERARDLSSDARHALRQDHSLPLLDELDRWVDSKLRVVGKTGKLAKAVRYAEQQRVYVRRCFSDGRFEIDNGAVERAIREPAIGRKNFLFTGSKAAAVRLAGAYTLVQSCRAIGINTRAYLTDVIGKLEAGWPARRLAELMPHRWARLDR
jgi:transposase